MGESKWRRREFVEARLGQPLRVRKPEATEQKDLLREHFRSGGILLSLTVTSTNVSRAVTSENQEIKMHLVKSIKWE
jgi:hypothetical protein